MLRPMWPVVAVLAWAAGSGCASLAQKPPTPAAEISAREGLSMTAPPGERYFILVFGSHTSRRRKEAAALTKGSRRIGAELAQPG